MVEKVSTILAVMGGKMIEKEVTGPLGEPVVANFALVEQGDLAIIEMAAASGLPLVPCGKENPMDTTTYGTGELIKAAIDEGAKKIIIGIGGSATNDMGVGMAQALGISFLNKFHNPIGFGGGELSKITKIDYSGLDTRISDVDIIVACDVNNPLYGENGAAHIYGPQKGARPDMIEVLDNNLRYLSMLLKADLGIDFQGILGSGAAGGLGAGLMAFLHGKLVSGIDIILDIYNIVEKLEDVGLVITGEGQIDRQSINGKVAIGLAKKAREYGVPVIALAGTVDNVALTDLNSYIDAIFSITQGPVSLNEAFANTSTWIEDTTKQIMRLITLNKSNF